MKLILKQGLMVLRPSKLHRKLVRGDSGLEWVEVLEPTRGRQLFPRDVELRPGGYEVERVENPFIRGGEPWLVLKGSRIGAAEHYFRQLAEATRGTSNGVEIL